MNDNRIYYLIVYIYKIAHLKAKPRVPMKSLFWDVIPVRNLKHTLWKKIDDTKIRINKDTLEEKFSQ